MTQLIPFLATLLGAMCFAVVYRAPRRYFFLTAVTAFAAGTILRSAPATWHPGAATFFTSLLVAALSHVFARATRAPAQCFLIPGIMFLVPGTLIYRAFSAALMGSLADAERLGMNALAVTLGISFGILIANWVVPSRKAL